MKTRTRKGKHLRRQRRRTVRKGSGPVTNAIKRVTRFFDDNLPAQPDGSLEQFLSFLTDFYTYVYVKNRNIKLKNKIFYGIRFEGDNKKINNPEMRKLEIFLFHTGFLVKHFLKQKLQSTDTQHIRLSKQIRELMHENLETYGTDVEASKRSVEQNRHIIQKGLTCSKCGDYIGLFNEWLRSLPDKEEIGLKEIEDDTQNQPVAYPEQQQNERFEGQVGRTQRSNIMSLAPEPL